MFKPATVKYGTKGTSVYILQAMLRALQYIGADGKPIDIDGIAGKNTVHAIKSFQRTQLAYGYDCSNNGQSEGIFDASCWNRLLGV